MKQSSIEWLIRELDLDNALPTMKAINHARAMHKEEIMDAFQEGKWDGWQNHKLKVNDKESQWTDPADYYNETFNTKEK